MQELIRDANAVRIYCDMDHILTVTELCVFEGKDGLQIINSVIVQVLYMRLFT
jgi:hypothetical protein